MRKKPMRFVLAAALVALVAAVPAAMGGAANGASVSATGAGPSLWFVELGTTPAKFRADARAAGIKYSERFAFTKFWNGVSLSADAANIDDIKQLPYVKSVQPVLTFDVAPTSLATPEMSTAIAMTGADKARSELGYTGAGVKVAVMDTGIDYDHADLGGDGVQRQNSTVFPTARVTHGWDFVGDAFDANPANATYNPNPVPDPYPDDCNGHGTHVAGIVGAKAAADGGVTGVAPDVTFGAYRVFGCAGSTTADIMVAAMIRAYEDGMDILNMSIGSAFMTWPQYPTGAVASELVEAGMVVVASIGNSGASGVYSAGSPGVGKNVIGVASFDNSHVALSSFLLSTGERIGYGNAAAAPTAPTEGTLPLARTGTPSSAADACDPIAADLTGKAVLIRRGTCAFHQKALNAQNAGAAAVVLYNNVAGRFSPTVAGTPAITIPVVAVSDTEGVTINNRIAAGSVDLIWSDETLVSTNPTGGLISSFSSYGLGAELDLKPDIGAPGGLIRAPYPLENGAYATISGTSMSSPHVAGAAALLKQAKPGLAAIDFRDALQNTAEPKAWWGTGNPAHVEMVHRQGAGMVQIDKAILATTGVKPGKLSLGESEAGPQTRTLTITNSAASAVTYNLSLVNALSTGGSTFSPGAFLGGASASFSPSSVTVPAGGSATVDVTITAPAGPVGGQYGGYVVLSPQGGGQTYRVPFAGFVGDYQSLVVLQPTSLEFPWLARLDGGSFWRLPSTTHSSTFTLAGNDRPYFLFHLAHQSRKLEFTVFDAATGKPVSGKGRNPNFLSDEYLRRNGAQSGTDFFFAVSWDGTLRVNERGVKRWEPVPNGNYYVVLKVLKALGDPANPVHTETWTSPTFTIAR